jgi:hypothetical protein
MAEVHSNGYSAINDRAMQITAPASQQIDELFDGKIGLENDRSECSTLEIFVVVGDRDAQMWFVWMFENVVAS